MKKNDDMPLWLSVLMDLFILFLDVCEYVATGLVVMVAWNIAMPFIFGLPTLDSWKALALFTLAFALLNTNPIPIMDFLTEIFVGSEEEN